ncbi:MAG: hypothetical protein M0020_05775 [Actinomycetota bacterium]|nr:hypothetical protein [Actinomycetota bacterium]
MTVRPTNRRAWPGRGGAGEAKARGTPRPAERFGDHGFVAVLAVAERHVVPERWGLGLALAGAGEVVTSAQLVVADDLGERDPAALGALREWAAATTSDGLLGAQLVEVVTRSAFCHPTAGMFGGTYWRGRCCVTADGGRTLGLLADHWQPGRGRFSDGWSLGLPGWGTYGPRETGDGRRETRWHPLLHEPRLRVAPVGGHGILAEWGRAGRGGLTAAGEPAGHWERERPFLGRFLDLLEPAFALDGVDSDDLGDHLAAFGLPALSIPAALPVDAEGAATLWEIVRAVHRLALRLDAEAARWLVSADDRRNGIATVSPRHLASPGTVASAILDRTGLTPPLAKHAVPDDRALDAWSAHSHGGWATADLRGAIVPVVDFDARSAHPASWSLLGCWDLYRAAALVEVDARAELMPVLRACAAGNLGPLLDPATYRRLGLTRAQVRFDGEPWPLEIPGPHGPRLRVGAAVGARSAWMPWPWTATAALLGRRVPAVRKVLRIQPVDGRVERGRPVPLLDGLVVPAGDDPVPWIVRLRSEAKARVRADCPRPDDERLAVLLRVIVNAAAYGLAARIDVRMQELRPARWSWPPVAATVPACTAMWLAMAERWVTDHGGHVVTRDTDGLAVVSTPEGGDASLAGGRAVHAVSWGELDDFLRQFDRLDPFGDGGAFFDIDRGEPDRTLHLLSLAPKRYVKCEPEGAGGFALADRTEHSLGGRSVEPAAMPGRDTGGRYAWTRPVAEHAIARAMGAAPPTFVACWDKGDASPWPELRRIVAASVEDLRGRKGRPPRVPAVLGARPFSPLVEASPDKLLDPGAGPVVALDPGTDLAEWEELAWYHRDGRPARVATMGDEAGVTHLDTLAATAQAWTGPVAAQDLGVIEVDPLLERRVGPSGRLIGAQFADPDVNPDDYVLDLGGGDQARFVVELVRKLGPRELARRFGVPLDTAKRIASGERRPSAATVRRVLARLGAAASGLPTCALGGCDQPAARAGARFCSRSHRERHARAMRRGSTPPARECAFPGCTTPARPASAVCSERHRTALRRLRAADAGEAVEGIG